jgi:DNA-binding NarL/FixJ family response regulator
MMIFSTASTARTAGTFKGAPHPCSKALVCREQTAVLNARFEASSSGSRMSLTCRLDNQETGFDVIKALRASFGEALPALIITGDTNPALVRSMTSRGITIQYKPLKLDALAAFISQATNRRVS